MTNDKIIIAIDGPAGAGKSTVAKRIAAHLQISYLDTGAMYRSLTLKAMRAGIDLDNEEQLVELAKNTKIDLQSNPEGVSVFLDDQDVSQEIRTPEVTNNTFYIARAPRVREIMVELQRSIGERKSVVAEGRDIGTVVFPHATKKFYLDANVEERSKRRFLELKNKGKEVDPQKLTEEVKKRDNSDFTRKVGPLTIAEDAIVIDSTGLNIDEVVHQMLKHIDQ